VGRSRVLRKEGKPWRSLVGAAAVALCWLLAACAGVADAGTSIECTEASLRADITAGGSYSFSCSGTIVLNSPLLVSNAVSLTAAAPNNVTIEGYNPSVQQQPGVVARMFTVANGGALELTGVDLTDGLVSAAPVETPGAGQSGESDCIASFFGWKGGDCGINGPEPTHYGEHGFDAEGLATNGGNAPAGGSAEGGCILIEAGGAVWLDSDTLSQCTTEGSSDKWLQDTGPSSETEGIPGYKQGIGGFGGEGGSGSKGFAGGKFVEGVGASQLCQGTSGEPKTPGGVGGNGNNGANGGNGSEGGSAFGGAIYDAGSLVITHTLFQSDRAIGGQGGAGGNGGHGGNGGPGGEGGLERRVTNCGESETESSEPGADGGNGSFGGDGGNGGNGGAGEGGAIFALGYLTIAESSFHTVGATGGNGGTAGLGGRGGQGGQGGTSGDLHGGSGKEAVSGGTGGVSGDGGNAGNSGNGGNSAGGAVYYATGSAGALPEASTTYSEDFVLAGGICAGLGSTAEDCGTLAGPAGNPGQGGESTPCAEPQAEKGCPPATEGIRGSSGAPGVIGHAGFTEGQDVAGAPGSGSPPAKKPSGESGGESSSSGGSSSGGSPGGSSPSTNTSTPAAHAGSPSTSGNSVSTSVSCTGAAGQSCSVTAKIAVQETVTGGKITAVSSRKGKHPKVRYITVTLGSTSVTVPAGSTHKLTVSLSSAGLRLLSSRHSLLVRFTVTSSLAGTAKAGSAPSVLLQTILTLHAGGAKHKR
jgi:hypothetical protein